MDAQTEIGPVPPANGLKTEDPTKSALKESIKKKGQNSYYYAHNYEGQNFNDQNAKTFYGDGLIYGGEPTLIEKRDEPKVEKKPEIITKKIAKYSWLDEDAKVKVYIELDQFPTQITKAMCDVKFEEFSAEIKIVDENGTNHILNLAKLYDKIEPEKSSWRFSEGKRVSVTFKKWLETKWHHLTKDGNK